MEKIMEKNLSQTSLVRNREFSIIKDFLLQPSFGVNFSSILSAFGNKQQNVNEDSTMKVINIVATISELDMCLDFFSKVGVVKNFNIIASKFGDEVEPAVEDMFQTFSKTLYRWYKPPVEIEIFLVFDTMTKGDFIYIYIYIYISSSCSYLTFILVIKDFNSVEKLISTDTGG
jgi:hypothetical protein